MGFGSFDTICAKTALPLCALVGSSASGIQTECYSRSLELANTIIFQGAASFMHILALIMTIFMILHAHYKVIAVGRKEIIHLFYIYFLLTVFSLVVDAGISAPGSGTYPYMVAIQCGLTSAFCACLVLTSGLGYQPYEDGTPTSLWILRSVAGSMFVMTFLISLFTFQSWGSLSPKNTVGLFVVLYIINGVLIVAYVVIQSIVIHLHGNHWPFGNIAFGVIFFVIGQVALYSFGNYVCESAKHYLDGLFIATVCNLLSVMMVYKLWDIVTDEQREFSVSMKAPGSESDFYQGDNRSSTYHLPDGAAYYPSQHDPLPYPPQFHGVDPREGDPYGHPADGRRY